MSQLSASKKEAPVSTQVDCVAVKIQCDIIQFEFKQVTKGFVDIMKLYA